VPTLSLGAPPEGLGLLVAEENGVTIAYYPDLRLKPGYEAVVVRLRTFLFLKWLELEGVRSTPVYEAG